MKNFKTKTQRHAIRAFAVLSVITLMSSTLSGAQAAILFQDDTFHDIESEAILIDSNGTGTENTSIQFGNDAVSSNNGTITWDVTNDEFDILNDVNLDGDVDMSNATQTRLREDTDPNANAECTVIDEVIVDTTDNELQICTVVGNPGTWVGVSAGSLNGITGSQFLRSDVSDTYTAGTLTLAPGTTLDANGVVDGSGSTQFNIREDSDPATNAACTVLGEIILDTTDSEIQVCTATGGAGAATWTNVAAGSTQDFESVYSADGDNTLTASGTFDIDATGALGLDSDAATTIGGAGVSVTSDGGALAITGDGTNDVDISNGGAAVDIDSASVDVLATAGVSIDAGAASNVTTSAGDLTLQATAGSTNVNAGEAAADAVRINASNAAGGIDVDAGTGGIAIDTTGAVSIDAVGTSNITNDSGNLTIQTTTSGELFFSDADFTDTVQLSDADTVWDAAFNSTGIIDNINDIATQLGTGADISTFNFTEDNVLADNDTVYAALDKLDLKFGDLASTANGEGASLIGIEDAAGDFTATTVEGALTELAASVGVPFETLTFEPEYENVVVFQDGSNNRGRLDADYDATNREQFYRWTSRQNSSNDIDLRLRFEVPADFGTGGDMTFRIFSDTNTPGDNSIAIIVRDDTADTTCHTDGAVTPAADTTWETLTITAAEINSCTLTAGDIVEVQMKLAADNTSNGAMQVGTIDYTYTK